MERRRGQIPVPKLICSVHNLWSAPREPLDHVLHSHALVLLLRGEGLLRMERAEIPSTRPLLWFTRAGTHSYESFRPPAESWYACFRWPGMAVRPHGRTALLFRCAGQRLRMPRWKSIDGSAATGAVELFKRLHSAATRQSLTDQLQAGALLLELFCIYAELPSTADASPGHRALLRFQHLLHQHALDEMSIEALAERAGASPDYLRNLFQRHYGARPVEYRNAVRLGRARDLLISTDMNVKEAARHTGFADPLYFSRVFRKRFGLSPREMIRRFRLRG